jgi:hypothetical protein
MGPSNRGSMGSGKRPGSWVSHSAICSHPKQHPDGALVVGPRR